MNKEQQGLLLVLQALLERFAETSDVKDQAKAKRAYNAFVACTYQTGPVSR